ncbi:hypothetical protein [Planctomycetes bacterium K23_9]|uniref:Uncharacterized protein n=1 Tax=Stieleria marina TaxID=1930275 RepID=A0A517NXW0_9BACT|nr:hypothetical protein K239x_39690 [Planctomycetes bacterium K23_9]
MTAKKLTLEDLENNEPLPEILQAEWAKDQVMQLFADLSEGADVQHVQMKSTATDATVTLAQAAAAFAAGDAEAIQVRYVFENEMWCDTIMPGDPTTKIIRNRLPVGH